MPLDDGGARGLREAAADLGDRQEAAVIPEDGLHVAAARRVRARGATPLLAVEGGADPFADRPRDRGRERVADLPVDRGLAAGESPPVVTTGPSLQPAHHFQVKPRQQVIRGRGSGRPVGDASPVYPQGAPGALGPRWAEVGTAVLLRPADDRRRDGMARAGRPGGSARPAPGGHQVVQHLADGRRRCLRLGPGEVTEVLRAHGDQDEPGPQLRDPVVAGVQQAPVGGVS